MGADAEDVGGRWACGDSSRSAARASGVGKRRCVSPSLQRIAAALAHVGARMLRTLYKRNTSVAKLSSYRKYIARAYRSALRALIHITREKTSCHIK